jgi:hypothetical protein
MKELEITKQNFHWRLIYDMTVQKWTESFEEGHIFENGSHDKYRISKLNDHFVWLVTLEANGTLTEIQRRFPRKTFAQLIMGGYFEKSTFARREAYMDLRKYDIGTLFKK